MKLRYRIHLVTTILFFAIPPCLAQHKPLFEPKVPDHIQISMTGGQMAKYQKLISDIYHDRNDMFISNKFKKWFKINIKDLKTNGFLAAKAKIAGNWKDHIEYKRKTLSNAGLKVVLKNGNIGGITGFRLLLPQTRNGMQEIFWSVLMQQLEFPTLYTKLVVVTLNGVQYYAIFQETPEKEFLERYSFRESPIVEVDDRQRMYDRLYQARRGNREGYNPVIRRGKVDNKNFLKNSVSNIVSIKGIHQYLSDLKKEQYDNAQFFRIINKRYGKHGLIWFNLKFIFDPIYNRLIPIYWDGNISLRASGSPCEHKANWSQEAAKIQKTPEYISFTEKVRELYVKRSGGDVEFSDLEKCVIHDVLVERDKHSRWLNEKTLRDRRLKIALKPKPKDIDFIIPVKKIDIAYMDKKEIVECKYVVKPWKKEKCRVLGVAETADLMGGREPPKVSNGYDAYTIPYGLVDTAILNKDTFATARSNEVVKNLTVKKNQTLFLHLEEAKKKRTISIKREDPISSRVVISGVFSEKDKLKVVFEGKVVQDLSEPESRYDENLLTSCVTFYDTQFNGGAIQVDNSHCEDGLNILRSNGTIDSIAVNNSLFDAIDFDFSELVISSIQVDNAGNDCIDLSAGKYKIKNAKLQTCLDKGLSVGERAAVHVPKISVVKANEGVVCKDLSSVVVDSFVAKDIHKHCLSAYQKKQEFGPAVILIKENKCVGKTYTLGESSIINE